MFESDAKEDLTIPSRDMATVAAANCETVGSLSNDTLLMLWNEGPKDWGTSDSSDSDNSSSRPKSAKRAKVADTPVDSGNDKLVLDDWTDTWLCSALIKDARKCSCEQISWNDFGSYNAELLAAKMCELIDKPISACYIGICPFPQDRWAGMGDKSHCHRWDFMSVVAFSDKAHLQMLEKHCVSAVRRFADGSGKPIANISAGGQPIMAEVCFIYFCYRAL